MATAAEVQFIRAQNEAIVRLATRDLAAFWSTLDLSRPESARNALLRFTPVLVDQYGQAAASIAADWYEDVRAAERVRVPYRARVAEPVAPEVVAARTRYGAGHLFTDTPEVTQTFLASALTKYVLQPGRDTIVENARRDPAAVGWHRETRPSASYASGCRLCRLLAQRGAVYKDTTVRFAAHGDCKCVGVPSWDANAPEVDAIAYVASERTSRMTPGQKARHNARLQRAIDEYVD